MNPVAIKLSTFISLSAEESGALAAALTNTFEVRARTDIALQGDAPRNLYFVLDGMVLRQKELVDGRRQILSMLLPGDPCDIGVTLLDQRDHSLTTAGPCTIARVSDDTIELLSSKYPNIRAALRWATLTEEAIAREAIVNVGQRDALARTAHLFCELFHRNLAIGRVEGHSIPLPLSQAELADVLSISAVHMNRVLQEMRCLNFLNLTGGRLTVHSLSKLEAAANFNPDYLHLAARFPNSHGPVPVHDELALEGRPGAALISSRSHTTKSFTGRQKASLKGQTTSMRQPILLPRYVPQGPK